MRIIVTGGTGFLGKRLCRKLKQHNHNTLGYDIVDGYDILNTSMLEQVFDDFKPDTIIHLAACADLNIFAKKPEISHKINVIGTRNILKLCDEKKVRLLFASTCCCYGNNETHPTDEDSPTCPTEPYAKSKKESEYDIFKSVATKGINHCCMRLATFYGPEMRKALAPAVFLDKAHNNETIEIHGDGKQTRTMTYVDDIVNGIVTITESDKKYLVVNITTEETVSVLDMVKYAKEITQNDTKVVRVEDRDGQIYKEVILSQKLQSMGWKAQTKFYDGMKQSYDYYKKNNNKW
jgi:UDP-glucose 4-epimerase